MADYIFNVKGLTADDRAQWEKDNIDELKKLGYDSYTDERKDRYFRNVSFRNKFGKRDDYDMLITMKPEMRDSMFMGSPDADIENLDIYKNTKKSYEDELSSGKTNYGALVNDAGEKWDEFDKMLDEISPYYKKFKNTNYFPMDANKKVDMMATFAANTEAFGMDVAMQKMAEDIKTEVSHNQPFLDKMYDGFVGMGAMLSGSTISLVGSIAGAAEAITGLDRAFGENKESNYWRNIWVQATQNPLTKYGDKVMQKKSWWVQDDPDMILPAHEVIRTAQEDKNLWDNIWSINTIPDLVEQAGFTMGSMLEGAAFAKLGQVAFNTSKMGKILNAANRTRMSAKELEELNKVLDRLNKRERIYNRYVVPAMVGGGEGAINGKQTDDQTFQALSAMVEREFASKVNEEVQRRMRDVQIPDDLGVIGEGKVAMTREGYLQQVEAQIRKQVAEEFKPMYDDAMERASRDANRAGVYDFAINSMINGALNVTLKAAFFGNRTKEAVKRGRVGKLFENHKFSIDNEGNVIANKVGLGRMMWDGVKEPLGEFGEEYSQDISSSSAQAGAEADMANYLNQRFNGVADDAIIDSMADNLGAAMMAAGKTAMSKDAIQSGIYGALGSFMGNPNVNAWFSKENRMSVGDKKGFEKAAAIANNIWRSPVTEFAINNRQENRVREESAAVLNKWLAEGNNRERLTSLRGSVGWAAEIQKAIEKGDKFEYLNSTVGKLVQDYFMLEQLKGTPLYDAYMEMYQDVLNAKEGDEIAQQIAKYDGITLEEAKKGAQTMLDMMGKVQEATADIERTLGDSVPQEVKESLVYGRISIQDWKERSRKMNDRLRNEDYDGQETTSGLTEEQKTFIARNGTSKPERLNKKIDELQGRIDNLNRNKKVLSKKQKKQLQSLNKQLKEVKKKKAQYERMFKAVSEGADANTVLTAWDILNLSPQDRYYMLNPENRKHYSEEQRAVIEDLEKRMTARDSEFMGLVEDSARAEEAIDKYLNQYNTVLSNPEVMVGMNRKLERNRRHIQLKKSYEKLNEIQDYEEFCNAVDDAFMAGDRFDNAVLAETLKENANFKKYIKDNDVVNGINAQLLKNDAFDNMSESDKDLVSVMTQFLSRKGVDISDYDAAVAALTATDENGQLLLTKYIDAINQRLENSGHKDLRISLDNISNVVSAYGEALKAYKSNEAVRQQVTQGPESKTLSDSEPASPSNVFTSGQAASSLEEAEASQRQESDAGKPVGNPAQQPPESQAAKPVVLPQNYTDNNKGDVLNAAERAYDGVENASALYDADAKRVAKEALDRLGDTGYESIDDYRDALDKEADRLTGETKTGGDVNERAGSLLKQVARSVEKFAEKSRQDAGKSGENVRTDQETKPAGSGMTLAGVKKGLNSFLSRKFSEWGVDKYIHSGKLQRGTKGVKVYYVSLNDITEGVKKDMENSGTPYSDETFLPVLAVVQDNDGPLVIGRKRYQPIGVLPNSDRDARAGEVRRLAMKTPEKKLLSKGNKKLESSVTVHSPELKISKNPKDDKDINTLIYNDMSPDELARMNDPATSEKEKGDIYKRHAVKFASRLGVEKNEKGVPTLYYYQPTLKGDGLPSRHPVMTRSLEETTDRSGTPLADVVRSGTARSLIFFNSRTKGFTDTLDEFLRGNDFSNVGTDGNRFTTNDSAVEAAEKIDSKLRKYLYASNGKYSVRPDNVNGRLGLALYLGDERLGRIADSLSDKKVTDEHKAEVLANLFMNGGELRKGLNWQVDKDPEHYNPEHYNPEDLTDMVYDNIVRLGIQSLDRQISGVEVSNPIKEASKRPAKPQAVINQDNATSADSQDSGTARTSSGQRVNTDTGLTDKGEKPVNNLPSAVERAREIVAKIQSDSREIQLTSNERNYRNTVTGKLYARVTSAIQAVEDGHRFDADSDWGLPSTNVGTGVDTLVRDFFQRRKRRVKVTTPLRKEYKGKLIFAQSGTGKTSIADNVNVLDSDYIWGNVLGVHSSLASTAYRLLSKEDKEKVSAVYKEAVKELLRQGKTVLTATLDLLDQADFIVYNKSASLTDQRTSSADRENRFSDMEYHKKTLDAINNYKGKARKVALKDGEYLASVLTDNSSFNITDEEVRGYESVVDAVSDFMSNFDISLEQMTDAGYSIDYLDRVIRGLDSGELVKGAGEMIAFMMQYDGDEKAIIAEMAVNDKAVDKKDLYNDKGQIITSRYMDIDKSKYLKVIGQSIAKELEEQFNEIKSKTMRKDNTGLIAHIKELIKKFLNIVRPHKKLVSDMADMSRHVARNILADNPAMIRRSLLKPGDEKSGRVSKVDLDKALSENPYERSIIAKLSKVGISLSGSASMAAQGDVYRPSENPLHDLDFETWGNMSRKDLEGKIKPLFKHLNFVRSIENGNGETILTYLTLDREFTVKQSKDNSTEFSIRDKKGREIGRISGGDLILNDGVQGKILDFFTNINPETRPVEYTHNGEKLLLTDYREVMRAKVSWARLKDLYDFNRFDRRERSYPNISEEDRARFEGQLEMLARDLEEKGLTVVPRDVTATGSLQVTDDKGVTRELPVAGTLDLLAYDREGNFHIYDMKTFRSNIDQEKKDKYARQLSLYKKFLEDKYGIKVKSVNIIPIKVEYPVPNKHSKYSVADGNQLLLNGKEFKGANPILHNPMELETVDVNIQYDKLTDEERKLIDSVVPDGGTVSDVKPQSDPKVDSGDNLRTGEVRTKRKARTPRKDAKPVDNSGDPGGIRYSDLTKEQQEALESKYPEVMDIEEYFNSMDEDMKKHELDCM